MWNHFGASFDAEVKESTKSARRLSEVRKRRPSFSRTDGNTNSSDNVNSRRDINLRPDSLLKSEYDGRAKITQGSMHGKVMALVEENIKNLVPEINISPQKLSQIITDVLFRTKKQPLSGARSQLDSESTFDGSEQSELIDTETQVKRTLQDQVISELGKKINLLEDKNAEFTVANKELAKVIAT